MVNKTLLGGVIGFLLGGLVVSTAAVLIDEDIGKSENNQSVIQSHRSYNLNLMDVPGSYPVNRATELKFDIRDENNKVVKDFDVVHQKQMHLIVVRKDRTNFQHVHPVFDKKSGRFTINTFSFPADGEYRVFADFTPSDAQKDPSGMKLPATPYQDVTAGDLRNYSPRPLGPDSLTSTAGGYEASIFFPPSDDSPGPTDTAFFAGRESKIAISINKGGQPFTNLQSYLGALGHMVVLGEDLEFIHAHPQTIDETNQGGVIVFDVNFPKAGRYKLYLQTKAGEVVTTNSFVTTVLNASNSGSPMNDANMPGMEH